MTFSDVSKDFFDNVFNLHKGLGFTFWQLIINPGKVGLDYIKGRRKSYTNPIRYLIIAVAIQAFLDYWFLHPELNEQPDFMYLPFLSESVNTSMAIWNHILATKYAFIHNLSMIFVFPLAFLFLFKKLEYNFTELLTVNFYYFSTGLILTVSFIFIGAFLIGLNLSTPVIIFITLGYVIWSSMQFFEPVPFWKRIFRIVLALIFFMVFRVFLLVYLLSLFFLRVTV